MARLDYSLFTKSANQKGGLDWCTCLPCVFAPTDGQRSCPFCGCGWLWSCSNCRKSYTVAQTSDGSEYVYLNRMALPLVEQSEQLTEKGRRFLQNPANWNRHGCVGGSGC